MGGKLKIQAWLPVEHAYAVSRCAKQYLAQQQLGEGGMDELAAGMPRADAAAWPMPTAKFIAGTFSEAQLDSAALLSSLTARQPNLCHAFYPAERALVKHDTTLARTRYDTVQKHCAKTATENLAAVAQLSRLGVHDGYRRQTSVRRQALSSTDGTHK